MTYNVVDSKKSSSTQTSQKSSPSLNRTARLLKIAGPSFDSVVSPSSSNKMPKDRSPRVLASGSPRSRMSTQKKRPAKLAEVQSLAHLQDELRRAKEQVSSLETAKRNYQQEYEETKKQLEAMSESLEESKQQLHELSASEDARLQELRRLSQERDKAWQSEVDAIQNQHYSMDSAALIAARNEVQKLKMYLQQNGYSEIQSLRAQLSETLSAAETMKREIIESKGSEARALEMAKHAQMQLEEAYKTAQKLQFAQKENSQLQVELRQLKVQSEQWRKAAETAAAMLSSPRNNINGHIVSKTVTLEGNYNDTLGGKMGSPLSVSVSDDNMDEDMPKKKNGNVLKKIGVLWNKGQK